MGETRKHSDPLVWSNMLLTLVGYIYLFKGWILQSVLIILASAISFTTIVIVKTKTFYF